MDSVGIVDQAIQNRISNGWVSDIFVPVFNRQLTGNDGGGMAMPLLDDLQEIPPFRICHGGQSQVVDGKEMGFAELGHDLSVTTIGFGQCEVVIKLRGTDVESSVAFTASLMSQGTS